ncbi:hypothetical protein OG618_37900 (plasmid) [Kitasatospora sp. NBC_01246]|uniref:hypothetical protein n=1 Tax=Kitasatospora sp. NBC_01246 TaxID=2903570 RepID=UPI002E3683D3|nr:hypothetical protein [Kitasatospora sp. NBC_01246]
MATLTRLLLPAQRSATDRVETPVTPPPATQQPADDTDPALLAAAVNLLSQTPDTDTTELARAAHLFRPDTDEPTWRSVIASARAQLLDRPGLTGQTGLSRATLQRLWSDRDSNGHPPAVTLGGVMHWCLPQWQRWHADLTAAKTREQHIEAGGIDRSGDPDELVPINALAKILGHKDTSTVLGWRKNPPAKGSIGDLLRSEPDGSVEYRGQVVPAYRRSRLWDAAAQAPARGRGGAGRGAGRKPKAHPWAGDARLDLARQLLAEFPDDTTAELIRAARHADGEGTAEPTWRQIFETAREHPEAT